MIPHLFEILIAVHIVTGSVGLLAVWIPIVGRKGGATHKRWGKVFAISMLVTGSVAIGISLCTLHSPIETHPDFANDPELVRGVFGWMMLYLATMTIMLAWYGLNCIWNRRAHENNRHWLNLVLQLATFAAALNCLLRGLQLANPLMMGISVVGLLAAVLNTHFIFRRSPPLNEWQIQHSRGLVGAGISVYTAFLAFGLVRWRPELALNPVAWSVPTIIGVSILLYHQFRLTAERRRVETRRAGT